MDLIQKANEYIQWREPGDDSSFPEIAERWGIIRSTLITRHRDQIWARELSHLELYPQQEKELVRYIQKLIERFGRPSVLSEKDWLKIGTMVRREVKRQSRKAVKKLRRKLRYLLVQNRILRAKRQGLRDALFGKKRHNKKSYTLQLNSHKEYHGGAVFWSSKKVRQARDDEMERRQQQQQLQLQNAERSESKKQPRLYKHQQAHEKRVVKERLKELQKVARYAKKNKAIQLSLKALKARRKAYQASTQKQKRWRRVVVDSSHVQNGGAAPAVPTRITRYGRKTRVPSKYK